MSAFANVTLLNDAAANVVFAPVGFEGGVAMWKTVSSVYDARYTLTQSVTIPKGSSPVARVRQKITVPIMDTVDATKKVSEGYVNIEYVLPKNSSDTFRKDLRALMDALVSNAITVAAVKDLEAIF